MTQSTADLMERARIKSSMLRLGEPIAFGSDADIIDELVTALATALEAQQALIDKLAEALTPFADAADDAERMAGHDGPLGQYVDFDHLRAARSSLKEVSHD